MENTYRGQIELDKVNKFFQCPTADATDARVSARLVAGDPWGGAILKFYGSLIDGGNQFVEIDSSITLTAAGMTAAINVKCIRELRVVITTASTTSGAIVEVVVCCQNPNFP